MNERSDSTQHSGPIFIGGEGRSGTTLISLMLDSHPQLCVGPELHFRAPENLGPYILHCLDLRENTSDDDWHAMRKTPELHNGVHFVNRCSRFGIDSNELREAILTTMRDCRSDLTTFAHRATLIDRLGESQRRTADAVRWGIKVMRDLRIADQYLAAWPRAQFIHLIRDGRDVAASQMLEHASWGYADIETAARNWMDLINRTRTKCPTGTLLEIRYEDLTKRPDQTMREVLRFLGMAWNDAVLRHHEVEHALFSQPHHHPSIDAARQPVNARAVGRYLNDLTAEQIAAYERIAGGVLEDHGYSIGVVAAQEAHRA